MSIVNEISRLQSAKDVLKTKLNNKNDSEHQITDETLDEYGDFVDSIPTGGGGITSKKDVNFYNYDGTIVNAYSKNEFLALSAMPENPSHEGLVAEGWNWTLADAKSYVTKYGKLNIGQMYSTASELSEFDIELNSMTGLTVTLNMDGTKDWGDGTTDTLTTHTYSNAGKYTITCDGTTMTVSSSSGLFGQSASNSNYYATNARLANVTSIGDYAIQNCYSLTAIIISKNVTSIGSYAFQDCYSLPAIVIPESVTSIRSYTFSHCHILTTIIIPESVTTIGSYAFQYCYSLPAIVIPESVTSIDNNAFQYCHSLVTIIIPKNVTSIRSYAFSGRYVLATYDFSNFTVIPTLSNKNAFNNINKIAKIVVPDNLYNDWIVATNWSTYADYIIKASEV